MVLPGTILFPHAMLPLYIFEDRYRKMLADTLAANRMFAIGMPDPNQPGEDIPPIGCAGLIRACVSNPDGTSHLVLQGVFRVRFATWLQMHPYRIAKLLPFKTANANTPEVASLAREIRTLARKLGGKEKKIPEPLLEQIAQTDDPEVLCDLLSPALLFDSRLRQALLSEADLRARLETIVQALHHLQDGE